MSGTPVFIEEFATLFGAAPLAWQSRLFNDFVKGQIPAALDLPAKATPVLALAGLAAKLISAFIARASLKLRLSQQQKWRALEVNVTVPLAQRETPAGE